MGNGRKPGDVAAPLNKRWGLEHAGPFRAGKNAPQAKLPLAPGCEYDLSPICCPSRALDTSLVVGQPALRVAGRWNQVKVQPRHRDGAANRDCLAIRGYRHIYVAGAKRVRKCEPLFLPIFE